MTFVGTTVRRIRQGIVDSPSTIRVLRRGVLLAVSGAPRLASWYCFWIVVGSLLPVLQVWITKTIVNDLSAGGSTTDVRNAVVLLAGVYAATLVLQDTSTSVAQLVMSRLGERATASVDHQLMAAGLRIKDVDLLERESYHDDLWVIRDTALYLPRLFDVLLRGVSPLITVAGLLTLLATVSPLIPLGLILVAIPYVLVSNSQESLIYTTMVDHSRAAREMDYALTVMTEPRFAKEVLAFDLGRFFRRRFDDRRNLAIDEVNRIRMRGFGFATLGSLAYAVVVSLVFWFIAERATSGSLALGDVALYFATILQIEAQMSWLVYTFSSMHATTMRLRRFFDFIDTADSRIKIALPQEAQPLPNRVQTGIELRHVGFTYPRSARPAVVDVSFSLFAGQLTALVGENGSGKSTLVKLLTRMRDPDKGVILLDGFPLANYDVDELRQRMTVVYQDPARLSLSVIDNIGFGSPEFEGICDQATWQDRIEKVAAHTGSDNFIKKLPHGYHTLLTRKFAGGVDLSGGQWQSIATSRALLRESRIALFDEPSAALDAEAEHRSIEMLRSYVQNKIAVLVSHRLSTVRYADQIVVLSEGEVVEVGSHDALIAAHGRYAELFALQAARYESARPR